MENYKRKYDNSHWISIAAVTNYYQLNNTKLSHRSVGESHGGFSWFLYSKSHESRIKVFAIVGSYLEALGSNEGEVSFSLFVCLFFGSHFLDSFTFLVQISSMWEPFPSGCQPYVLLSFWSHPLSSWPPSFSKTVIIDPVLHIF